MKKIILGLLLVSQVSFAGPRTSAQPKLTSNDISYMIGCVVGMQATLEVAGVEKTQEITGGVQKACLKRYKQIKSRKTQFRPIRGNRT